MITLDSINYAKNIHEMMENQGFEAIIPFMRSYDIPITHGLIIFFISLFICIYPIITIYKLNPVKAMKR